jgi:hypothetical protein
MAVNLNQTKGIRASREVSGEQAQTNPNLLKWVIIGLAIAAVTELLLWRTFSRIGVFIPKHDAFQTVYTILTQIGVIVLNFAVLLAVASLVLTLLRLREFGYFGQKSKVENLKSFDHSTERSWLLTIAVAAILMVLGFTFVQMALVQHPLVSFLLRLAQLAAFTALAADYWRSHRSWQARLFISLMLFGYAMQITAKLILDYPAQQPEWNWLQNLYLPMLMLGETAVLVNGFGLYLVYGGGGKNPARSMARNWPAFLGALAITAIFLGLTFLTVAESDIVPILGLYALGYTMQLPLALYVIALFFLLYTVFYNLGHLRQGQVQRAAAFGLILIFTGGYLFNISNQYLFALIGLLLLTRPEILKEW